MRSLHFRAQEVLINFYKLFFVCFIVLSSCKKDHQIYVDPTNKKLIAPSIAKSEFSRYSIYKGEHYCDSSRFETVELSEMKFLVIFDSSAIYKSANPENQYAINKLYGFSDNNEDHHQFSARFGWRWSDGAVRLFGYIYNGGVMEFKEIAPVSIGSKNECSIKVTESTYIFSVNNITTVMSRKSITSKAVGYKLFPYFGGVEVAPHDVFIWIKDL